MGMRLYPCYDYVLEADMELLKKISPTFHKELEDTWKKDNEGENYSEEDLEAGLEDYFDEACMSQDEIECVIENEKFNVRLMYLSEESACANENLKAGRYFCFYKEDIYKPEEKTALGKILKKNGIFPNYESWVECG